jgi:hypothetical protein
VRDGTSRTADRWGEEMLYRAALTVVCSTWTARREHQEDIEVATDVQYPSSP